MTKSIEELAKGIEQGLEAGELGFESRSTRARRQVAEELGAAIPVEPDSIEPVGWSYFGWRILWPGLQLMLLWKRGEGALIPPSKGDQYRRWWKVHLYRLSRRVISDGIGGVSATALTVASIILAVAISVRPTGVIAVSVWCLAGLYLLGVTVCYSAYLALRALPPDRFAQTALVGRSHPEALRTTAYYIRSQCRDAARSAYDLDEFLRSIESLAGTDAADARSALLRDINDSRERLSGLLKSYRSDLAKQAHGVRRLEELKLQLANQLGLPRRRLCDHILQFSPVVFANRAIKYADNWQTLLSAARRQDLARNQQILDRMAALVRQNLRIFGQAARRARLQEQLLDASSQPLLGLICRFAAMHSTSGSLVQYAWTMSLVAAAGVRTIDRWRRTQVGVVAGGPEDNRFVEDVHDEIFRILRFLRRKHWAYPGVELHSVCLEICRRATADEGGDGPTHSRRTSVESASARWESLTRILESISDEVPGPSVTQEDAPSPGGQDDNPEAEQRVLKHSPEALELISEFGLLVEGYVSDRRAVINEEFRRFTREYFGDSQGLIITAGYSKTARQAIRFGLLPPNGAPPADLIRVFVLSEDAETADRDPDARLMIFELTEVRPGLPHGISVGSGPASVLAPLLQANRKVLIVTGAECFDARNNIVHPRVGQGSLASLRVTLSELEIEHRIVAVAETYKHRSDILEEETLYRHHLDRLVVHKVDDVISDASKPRKARGRGRSPRSRKKAVQRKTSKSVKRSS